MHQYSFPWQKCLDKKNLGAQEGGDEKESQSTSEEKIYGEEIAQPMPANPTLPMNPIPPAEPNPTVATLTAATQMPVAKSAATSIPVTVYNLAQGKFEGIPYPTGRSQVEENPSAPNCNMPSHNSNLKLQPHRTGKIPHGLILLILRHRYMHHVHGSYYKHCYHFMPNFSVFNTLDKKRHVRSFTKLMKISRKYFSAYFYCIIW